MSSLTNWLELLRVLLAFGALFAGAPVLAVRVGRRRDRAWHEELAPSFLRAILFAQISVTILGQWRLCLPGMMTFVYLAWLLVLAFFPFRRSGAFSWSPLRGGFLGWLERMERGAHRNWFRRLASRLGSLRFSPMATLFCLLIAGVLFERAQFPVHNYRFLEQRTYARALSLQTLLSGQPWEPDGSVAFLAPVAFLSGLDGATVVRLSGPVLWVVLVLAAGFCALRYSGSLPVAYLASGLAASWPLATATALPVETGAPEIAAIFWLLAVAALRDQWHFALGSAGIAVFADRSFGLPVIGMLLCVFASLLGWKLAQRLPRFVQPLLLTAGATAFALALASGMARQAPDGPLQYEAAARAVNTIAREFRRNEWLIVSPGHEVPALIGRGWHAELSEFVTAYSPAQVSQPGFKFPYEVKNIFLFVEKRPLAHASLAPSGVTSQSEYFYGTRSGRESLEFQAAALAAACVKSQPNASIYYEDADFLVYHIVQ
ncbi:MAG: hypothetical protein HY822_12800 [Acidobacteria bacterium]|nr:hypothetical protein [Acidobacteriota bacterium]